MSLHLGTRRAAVVAAAILLLVSFTLGSASAAGPETKKANYDLAARWTPAKVGKLVFDTAVQPHWLLTGDRFWYSYETSQGRKWFIVDPSDRNPRSPFSTTPRWPPG